MKNYKLSNEQYEEVHTILQTSLDESDLEKNLFNLIGRRDELEDALRLLTDEMIALGWGKSSDRPFPGHFDTARSSLAQQKQT